MNLNLDQLHVWFKALPAVGLALTLGAAAARNEDLVLVGLGMLFVGLGELANWKRQQDLYPATFNTPAMTRTYYIRRASPVGIGMDALGTILAAIGLVRLIFSVGG
jgi:hypothetical protein